MAVLDDLSGFEFEDVMEDVFRNLGFENVRQAERTADEGRDVIMEEVVDGTRRAIIVECKQAQGRSGARSSRSSTRRSRRSTSTVRNAGWSSRPAGSRTLLKSTLIDSSRTTTPIQSSCLMARTSGRSLTDRSRPLQRAHRDSLRRYPTPVRPGRRRRRGRRGGVPRHREHRERRSPGGALAGDVPSGGCGHRGHERRLRDVGGRHPPDQRPHTVRCPR